MKFKDKHALETLPKTIAALQAEGQRPAGQARRSANSMRATAPASRKSPPTSARLQRKLAAAEEQWLELEILREELAGG